MSLAPAIYYAEVALDLKSREISQRLFTYEIPAHLSSEVFVGTQVLVPFGRQEGVPAYVVSIKNKDEILNQANSEQSAILEQTRPISEVLDSGLIFERSYIEFLYWVADYYLCSISDVLKAALPQELGARVKRMVRLLGSGENSAEQGLLALSPSKSAEEIIIRNLLKAASEQILPVTTLLDRSKLERTAFYSVLGRLKKQGQIEIFAQSVAAKVAKMIKYCFLVPGKEPTTKKQSLLVEILKNADGCLPLKELQQQSGCTQETIKRMQAIGILEIKEQEAFRDPLSSLKVGKALRPELKERQAQVLKEMYGELELAWQNEGSKHAGAASDAGAAGAAGEQNRQVQEELQDSRCKPCWRLLHGVTGSGKTEVYMRLIERTLSAGKACLLLVPEISLTPQLSRRLLERFGDSAAIWHSGLSAGERFDTWTRIQKGKLQVVLGARSAILLNVPNLGLIILDEEHDSSYKQSSPDPRYSAKTLAFQRAVRENCFLLLGSATPDAASYFEASRLDRILVLPERVHEQALPEAVLVDMRNEFRDDRSVISRTLENEIASCLEREEQVILLINRRGYASHVFCRACGHVLRCRHCSVSLVLHGKALQEEMSGAHLSCHHCGYSQTASKTCPACAAPFMKQFGIGTQKVEEETARLFPQARILRLDSDISSRKGAYEEVFSEFSDQKAQILIGTQIVAKGLDIANVTLVGVLAADAAFNLPDFRSMERGFQLLTQVAGRAGRGLAPGKVVLQTYNTELPTLLMAKNQDYASFIEAELAARKELEYPPFSCLIRIVASGADELNVQAALEKISEEMSHQLEGLDDIKILGPAPCLIERIKGMYRQHIIVKNLMGEPGRKAIGSFLRGRKASPGVRISVDVDPLDLI